MILKSCPDFISPIGQKERSCIRFYNKTSFCNGDPDNDVQTGEYFILENRFNM